MKAYKCDRCGKLYEIKKNRGVGTFKSYDITNNPYVSSYDITNNPYASDCLDLCNECFDELQEWMTVYKEAESEDLPSVTSQKWIPVSERLPKENTSVIGKNRFGDIYKTELYNNCGEHKWCADGSYDVPIVAWIPLPKPYTESEGE